MRDKKPDGDSVGVCGTVESRACGSPITLKPTNRFRQKKDDDPVTLLVRGGRSKLQQYWVDPANPKRWAWIDVPMVGCDEPDNSPE